MKTALLLTALLAVPLAHAHGDKKSMPAEETVSEQTDWGIAGKRAQLARTITLDMTDAMRFTPDTFAVQEGETVRFVVRNTGRMLHEMVIGTPAELAKHAALIARFPGMEHDAPYMVHVSPGNRGEIVWHFNRAGSFDLAGMRGTITVTPKQGDAK